MAIRAIDLATIAAGTGGFVVHGQEANDQLGLSAVSAGDVNGDGLDDLIMGARLADAAGNAKTNAGGTYVLFGRPDGFAAAIDAATLAAGNGGFVIHGQDAGDLSGQPVAAAGDVNGDGLDDVIVGAAEADGPGNARYLAGDSFVVFGRSSGLGPAVDLAVIGNLGFALNGPGAGDLSGSAVAGAGDVNGDGIADLIIGAPEGDAIGDGKASAGDTYIVFGRIGGFSGPLDLAGIASGTSTEGIHIPGAYASIRSGQAAAHAGDLNSDGLDDIIIGAPGLYAPSGSGKGAVYIVYGTQGGTIDLAHVALGSGGFAITQKNWTETRFGFSVNSAGDLNADGYSDLVMGNYWGGPPAHVVLGRAGGFGTPIELDQTKPTPGNFAILVQEANDRAGMSVASAGDVNGDGFDDLVIGAPGGDAAGNMKFDSGEAYVVFGHAGGFGANIRLSDIAAGIGGFVIYGQDPGDSAGRSVASAGDINGDGFDDLIIGAHGADGPNNMKPDAGSSYVVFGRNFTAVVTHLGTAAAETLAGTDGDDVMIGGLGNDTLIGGRGKDVLKGGAGDDVLRIADFADRRVEGDRGDDTLALDGMDVTLDLSLIADTLLTGIEAIDVTGSGANTLRLTQRDVLNLSDTSNTLRVIANPDDTLELADGGWIDGGLQGATRSFTQGNATVLLTVIPYGNPPAAVLLIGDAGPNALGGGGGNDTLSGEGGDDTLNGGTGADLMQGGPGNDMYRVGETQDTLSEAGTDGYDIVRSTVTWTLGDGFEDLRLIGMANRIATGNALDNRLAGNAGANQMFGLGGDDTLDGGAGNDTMHGGAGNDLYVVDSIGDYVDEFDAGAGGHDIVVASVSYTLHFYLEALRLVGTADIDGACWTSGAIIGNDGANLLTGSNGDDTLSGGAGNDTLIGHGGANRLNGGTGDDTFRVGAPMQGRDTIVGFVSGEDRLACDAAGFGLPIGDLDGLVTPLGAARFQRTTDGLATAEAGEWQFTQVIATGTLFFDADGSGASAGVIIAKLAGHPELAASDIWMI
jgi:Ca2+-binding RTX toxin-like protein